MNGRKKKAIFIGPLSLAILLFLGLLLLAFFNVLPSSNQQGSHFDAFVFYVALLVFDAWGFFLLYRMKEK